MPSLEAANAPALVARIVRVGQPTKVLRVALSLLATVLKAPASTRATLRAVAESGVGAVVGALAAAEPPIADPELADDVRWLGDALAKSRAAAPADALERYAAEVASGRFGWTAIHSADFWREHARAFEKDGFAVLRDLAKLMNVWGAEARARAAAQDRARLTTFFFLAPPPQNPETDEVTLAVAVSDVGSFVSAHPQGRSLAATLGFRARIVQLVATARDEDDVKQQALLALGKIIGATAKA